MPKKTSNPLDKRQDAVISAVMNQFAGGKSKPVDKEQVEKFQQKRDSSEATSVWDIMQLYPDCNVAYLLQGLSPEEQFCIKKWDIYNAVEFFEEFKKYGFEVTQSYFACIFGSVLTRKGLNGEANDLDLMVIPTRGMTSSVETLIMDFFRARGNFKVLSRSGADGVNQDILIKIHQNNKLYHIYIKEYSNY